MSGARTRPPACFRRDVSRSAPRSSPPPLRAAETTARALGAVGRRLRAVRRLLSTLPHGLCVCVIWMGCASVPPCAPTRLAAPVATRHPLGTASVLDRARDRGAPLPAESMARALELSRGTPTPRRSQALSTLLHGLSLGLCGAVNELDRARERPTVRPCPPRCFWATRCPLCSE